ncbi:hypothetical protein EZS27_034188 [termite gut metagenome]|uniref:RiboL-PSP-HEPN domain-containing protein n=1 Tax=termite gut metagenome TaxID=433724 RepID=A0A5J4Q2Q5_9ZZZZ
MRIENELLYTTSQLGPNLTVAKNIAYEQYYEILDVLNEVIQSKDILSRFLKIYHILEFLSYRVLLVQVVEKTQKSKTFVREILKFSDNIMRKSEKQIFVDNFKSIFEMDASHFKSQITAHKPKEVRAFIKDNFNISFDPTNITLLANLIYDIRCSIVHNKASELHFTISNPEDYRLIIELIKQLIKALEYLIVKKISTSTKQTNIIQYPIGNLDLY